MSDQRYYWLMDSPVGSLMMTSDGDALTALVFEPDSGHRPDPAWIRRRQPFESAVEQLIRYFEGEAFDFDIDVRPEGTPFQKRVWEELRAIPHGRTLSYSDIARRIGKPDAVRAVGAANGRNPVAIIIPCHRVIGADGSLTGYGGGLRRKRQLLELEAGVRELF